NNLALRGTAAGLGIVTTAIEHASVLETARALGAPLSVVPVDREGRVDAGQVVAACDAATRLVSVGLANGEVGSLAPVAAITAARLVERLWTGLRTRVPGVVRNGPADGPRLPNTLNVSFPGAAGESLLVLLDLAGVAVSLGSACAAGAAEPSHVLLAMGRDRDAARSGVRFSVGPSTTAADIDRVLELLPALVAQARGEAAA